MKFVSSLIVVKDIARSRQFYQDVLGLKVIFDFGENVTFEGNFAIHLEPHFMGLIDTPEEHPIYKAHSFELYFETDDLETLQAELVAASVDFLHDIREHPWRQRAMRFHDPDQHIVEVGEPMDIVIRRLAAQGLLPEQIHSATSMPLALINSIVT